MESILETKSSLLFVFRNRETGEYVDEDGNPTEDIIEAVGYPKLEDATRALDDFDEPEEWYIVKKLILETIVGEPIQITKFI